MTIEQDLKFIYDSSQGYDWNFDKWLRWTNREHRNFSEEEYTKEQGKVIFEKLFINLDGNNKREVK
tara:strand:- start:7119 stop:7316 length:198 start_codon:yes stop_codon:yes gene_type:complete